jgi:hypothetical protein
MVSLLKVHEGDRDDALLDVMWVHGLDGHPRSTWSLQQDPAALA